MIFFLFNLTIIPKILCDTVKQNIIYTAAKSLNTLFRKVLPNTVYFYTLVTV